MVSQDENYDEYGFPITPKEETPKPTPLPVTTSSGNSKKTMYMMFGLIFFVILLALGLLSGFIAWNCYANNLTKIRIIKTILATLFFYLYLPYFFLLRVILQQACF